MATAQERNNASMKEYRCPGDPAGENGIPDRLENALLERAIGAELGGHAMLGFRPPQAVRVTERITTAEQTVHLEYVRAVYRSDCNRVDLHE